MKMNFPIFIFLSFLLLFSYQTKLFRSLKETEEVIALESKANTKIALPWGLTSTKTKVKEDNYLLVRLFGTQSTGNQWRLLNEEEIKFQNEQNL